MAQLGAFAVCTVDTVLLKKNKRNQGECLVGHVARYVDVRNLYKICRQT